MINIGWREYPKRWMILLIAAVCCIGIGIGLIFNRSEQSAPPPVVDKQRTAEVWLTTEISKIRLRHRSPFQLPITMMQT